MSRQQVVEILENGAKNPPPENASPDMMRAWVEGFASQLPAAANVTIRRVTCGSCDGDLILPAAGDSSRLIIYYHGGGFYFCSARTHRAIASNLARAAGCAVLAPDYRLAPEHTVPAAHDDAFAVYEWALKQGYAPGKLALGGDSAGGNLALATGVRAKKSGLPIPCALVLLSPWLDFAGEGASHRETTDDPIVTPEILEGFVLAYLGNADRKSSEATPFYEDFRGLPPVLTHVGSWEMLRDDSLTLVKRLRAANVAAEVKVFEGMFHVWQLYAPVLDEGMESIEQCAAFIKAHQK